ncbi:GNAT family N-acetyltransferase [Spelaeicoccus albus]|uniref:RimJ/RimL family protein N-acetyltransferase n=1 Tax=Spelaeicoccus albus TaxID=1280376 RepID=A0A7Z0A8V7_9MICO|nr:GNAT family protein [Spelaeicoccus albus]NYI66532.1 RimJ/RimL family protein N-acetyltransferase [Spelaeicoccus albus]
MSAGPGRTAGLPWPESAPTSGNISLRRFNDCDIPMVMELSTDDYVPKTGTLPAHATEEQARAWIDRQLSRAEHGKGFSFAIAVEGNPVAVGQVGLWLTGLAQGRASVGYAISPSARGHGTAGRALRLAVKFAWTIPELHRIEALIEPWNAASIRTAESAGFEREGVLRSYREIGGVRRDMAMFAVVRN